MPKDKNYSLVYVLLASLFNVIIAYIFGNNGYEAFIAISIALGILVTWQTFNLGRLLFRYKVWLIIKLISLLPLIFFWFIAVAGVMLAVSKNVHNPGASTPAVNWLVVALGTLPFLMPRVGIYNTVATLQKTAIGLLVSLYSIMVLYIAALGFYDNETTYRNLLLIIAIQLQYILNYIVIRTDYLNRSHAFARDLAKRLKSSNNDIGVFLTISIVGMPFILPIAIIVIVSTL